MIVATFPSLVYLWRICGIPGLSYLPLAWPLPLPGCTGVIRRHFVEWTAWLARCARGAGRTCREKYHCPVTSCRPITVNLLGSTVHLSAQCASLHWHITNYIFYFQNKTSPRNQSYPSTLPPTSPALAICLLNQPRSLYVCVCVWERDRGIHIMAF